MTPEQLKLIRTTLEKVQSIIECTYGHDDETGARNEETSDYSSSDIVEFLCEIEKAVDESLAVLQTIQTPPVPETAANGHEWRIVWKHNGDPHTYGTAYVLAPDDVSARLEASALIEREWQIHRSRFSITSCSIIRAILTNGETSETFSPQENA